MAIVLRLFINVCDKKRRGILHSKSVGLDCFGFCPSFEVLRYVSSVPVGLKLPILHRITLNC